MNRIYRMLRANCILSILFILSIYLSNTRPYLMIYSSIVVLPTQYYEQLSFVTQFDSRAVCQYLG